MTEKCFKQEFISAYKNACTQEFFLMLQDECGLCSFVIHNRNHRDMTINPLHGNDCFMLYEKKSFFNRKDNYQSEE